MNLKFVFAGCFLPLVLSGCAPSVPGANEYRLTSRGDGSFEGAAGANWTVEEISGMVAGDPCQSAAPAVLDIEDNGTSKTFSGRC